MSKKQFNITVDEKLWGKAKGTGINISYFVETCLDSFLNINPEFIAEYVKAQKTMQKNIKKDAVDVVKAIMGGESKKRR